MKCSKKIHIIMSHIMNRTKILYRFYSLGLHLFEDWIR